MGEETEAGLPKAREARYSGGKVGGEGGRRWAGGSEGSRDGGFL